MTEPQFPPLFTGQAAYGDDPFRLACAAADAGCDAGLVVYDLAPDILRAAIVFAPDVPLGQAAAILPICGVGFQNALGVLAPPEVGVHLGWNGDLFVNGGRCGALRMAAKGQVNDEPDWVVVSLSLTLWPADDETGQTPDITSLYAEGCAEVGAIELLEAWVRHALVGINTWADDGPAQLHREWAGLAHDLSGEITVAGHTGTYIGLDENLGLLLKVAGKTVLLPLTENLTRPL
ncbi:biotin/lipoate--protein ligase family protein [Tateyamaria sp.]|uniref:biotin/lipoate--protein ligase family protein n=1 Tax=Tateyamaria sp. TaxID=1929288 RepID=UPI00329F6C40